MVERHSEDTINSNAKTVQLKPADEDVCEDIANRKTENKPGDQIASCQKQASLDHVEGDVMAIEPEMQANTVQVQHTKLLPDIKVKDVNVAEQ